MKTSRGSVDDGEQEAKLNTLLACAPRYAPQEGLAERVLAAIHKEEATMRQDARQLRPWCLHPYSWGGAAAAACLTLGLGIALLAGDSASTLPAESLVVDDSLLVDEVLDCIDDPDLISAICSVSGGSYSISTGAGAY